MMMTPLQLKEIGQRAWAQMWQTEVAAATNLNKGLISRIISGTRAMSPTLVERIRPAVIDKLANFADILNLPGMPEAGSFESQAAADLIREAVLVANGDKEAVARAKRRASNAAKAEAKQAA
ncbi:putative HTH domain protein [Caulobacter phage CcrBL9]|uniref:Putative HTH domain protein n=1 Tax=Caulobacter phage CcrBL9 TaxID=2283270 RepID=A0A385EC65_9CAUD|nr:putative HTH domain protein [Caulobacter phage CcrBL9]AXQ69250.1 putative HTH domain protein [Caulobacter phage CcrBL9]